MSYRESDIMFENPTHWVLRTETAFEVYQIGITHSTRRAIYGKGLANALTRAIADAERRHADATRAQAVDADNRAPTYDARRTR